MIAPHKALLQVHIKVHVWACADDYNGRCVADQFHCCPHRSEFDFTRTKMVSHDTSGVSAGSRSSPLLLGG